MKKLLIVTAFLISSFVFAGEGPSRLKCGYKLVEVISKKSNIERVGLAESLFGIPSMMSPIELDGQLRSTGEQYIGVRGITIWVQGTPEKATVQLKIDNGSADSSVVLLNREIEPRAGLFEASQVPNDYLIVKYGNSTNKIDGVILSCLPVYP